MTKISITIPTYNGEKNIKKQIDRLINDCRKAKIFNFYEIIICDNCSNDNTKKIVTKYKRKINTKKIVNIKFYGSKNNLGYPKNFIRATKLSKSKYTIFLCDDNIPSRNFYINLYNLFKNKDYNELCFFSTNKELDLEVLKIIADLKINSSLKIHFINSGNFKKKFSKANKIGATGSFILGEDEWKIKKITWKDFSTGVQELVELGNIDKFLNKKFFE